MVGETSRKATASIGPTRATEDRTSLAMALRSVAKGDRDAFEEVYRRTSAKLYGVCVHLLPARHEAEEVLQDVYFAVWRSAASFDETRGTAMTWLITLARNRAVDQLRKTRRIASEPIHFADAVADPQPLASDVVEADDQARRLLYCMTTLGDDDARFLRTAFFEGSTYPELAERSGMPVGTLKSRVRRALRKLRLCLQ